MKRDFEQDTMRVIIAGGSGFLGISLASHLAATGTPVVLLSRNPPKVNGPWRHVQCDARTLGDWHHELDGARAIVNLVGRSVDCIKSPDHQDEILRSRVESTRVLGEACRTLSAPPPVWVQMSSAHIYGDPPEILCTEESPFGCGFAPFVAQAWEREFAANVLSTQRGVVLRTSFVLGRDRGVGGGAVARLRILARLGLGGKVGTGKQGISWIHEADMNRIFERALNDQGMQGTYIASAPHPVSQQEFMRELRRVSGMPIGIPTPEWLARIGARWVMRTDPELALYGRYVVPKRLNDEGFSFCFPQLRGAMEDLFQRATEPQTTTNLTKEELEASCKGTY